MVWKCLRIDVCYISCASFGGIYLDTNTGIPFFQLCEWLECFLAPLAIEKCLLHWLCHHGQVTNFALWTYNFVKAETFFSFFHIQNSGLSISSIPISGILSGIYALIRSGILFWHLFRFFFEMGAAGPQPRAPVVLRSATCLSSTCGKTMWEIWGAATQLLFVFFFAAHQCAFWNANLCFFVFAGVVFGTPISSVFLLVRTFQGKRKQNNDCFRRLSFGFTLLRDFWAT